MSFASGKCDLCDFIEGLAGWHDKDGNKVNFGEGSGPYHGDEYQDFLEFKRRTGGVIHQRMKVKVSKWNQEDVQARCPQLGIIHHSEKIPDRRCKDGFRTKEYDTYTYYGDEYKTLKELNGRGVYITLDIHFETLLDLIPYYPHLVASSSASKDSMYVVISNKPYPIEKRDESMATGGRIFDYWLDYAKALQEHYNHVLLKYYGNKGASND